MNVVHDGAAVTVLADPARFTGRVWRTDYIAPADAHSLSGLRFVYEPGARSHWHVHEREQAIVAIFGCGLVAWQGLAAPIALRPGDWWHVEPGVAHWHGAAPDAPFGHLAVTAGGSTSWLQGVGEEEYRTPPTP